MPRFFFHVYDGRLNPDREGIDLPGWIAARDEAARRAGQLTEGEARPTASGERRYVEVADDAGLLLFRLDMTAASAPALPAEAQAAGDAAEGR